MTPESQPGLIGPRRNAKLAPQVLLAVLTLACLAPFLGKAFHVDDALFVWAGRQIANHPLDPYGFDVNWYTSPQPMAEVTKNPPLASYYIAAVGSLFGWSETALHAAFLLPALAAIWGTFLLATKLTRRPLLAAAATLAAPGFLVCGTSVMCDVMMLAFWVLAAALWLKGLESGRASLLAASGLLIAACALTKYFGIALIPLLLVYSIVRQRRLGVWLVYLLAPVAVVAGYQYWTRALYGTGLLGSAVEYARAFGGLSARQPLYKALAGLSFAGGCALPALTFAPMVWTRRSIAIAAAAAGMAGILTAKGLLGMPYYVALGHRMALSLHLAVFIAGGMCVLALAVSDWRRRGDAGSALLGLWILGTLAFASFVNWTVNARSVLPMIPAVGILLARRMEGAGGLAGKLPRAALIASLAVSGAVSLWVTWADARLANSARTAAQYVRDRLAAPGVAVRFEGHWGFQYYMQDYSFQPLDLRQFTVANGDLVVIPDNNTAAEVQSMPARFVESRETVAFPVHAGATTISVARGAGFYSDFWGPLPYAFGPAPSDAYTVLRLRIPRDAR